MPLHFMKEEDFIQFDREIRFDIPASQLKCINGEEEIDFIPQVEDTKGNNGEKGGLKVTNLRIIWFCQNDPSLNLSIGHDCVKDMYIRTADSVLKGATQSLYVVTKYESNKFEFIFTNYGVDSPRLFSTAQTVVRAYETSRTYRDVRLRGTVIKDDELKLLKHEKIISKVPGVWNVSSSAGNIGTIHTTNIRVVWHANAMPNFNVSIPYLQMEDVNTKQSKVGLSLAIQATKYSGGHTMGFRVEPQERLASLTMEIQQLRKLYFERPIFGIDYIIDDADKPTSKIPIKRREEDFVMEKEEALDVISQYYADSSLQRDRPPVYCPSLGLAVEALPEGYTVEKVWSDLLDTAMIAKQLEGKLMKT
ncbi:putative tubulin epsilon chain [Monocercomonoides exilis]|uniref:putative tubulin epsilon chain n=1 Tax=Monocercomonoides exilis TaxID=2049356 RepID=UPI00355A5B03|nr:putative tubulin epsilon chain [Monocercomonoides exilis]|eukprot:MONOS_6116.1-p1 / transcript=MONOS_6116.1 / gene=MONOS_6116 / organism=Monocercomonoides_exilis_PA203 / gene_product=bardet-Biedl syndrome 5 protein / transcript_product=bardet-Biedl syndrome 5 protein / location=Mono_scaffold00188:67292-68828(-) / protein_length=362 / sequence_SO=supercontig / SO=protein_coding / is_pseudo=false